MASLINPKLAIYTSSYSLQSLIMNHQSCIKSKFDKLEQIESPKVFRSRARFLKKRPSRHEILPNSRARKNAGKQRKRRSSEPVCRRRPLSDPPGPLSLAHHASRNSVFCRTRFRYRFNCLGASCASHLVIYGQDPLLLLLLATTAKLSPTFVSVGRMFVVIQVVDVASFLTQLLLLTCFHQGQVPFALLWIVVILENI